MLCALRTTVGRKCQDGGESGAQFPPPSVPKRFACNYCNIHVRADVRLCGSCFRARKCFRHRYGEPSPICCTYLIVCALFYLSLFVDLVSWQVFCPCKGYKGEGPVSIASANVTSCLKHSTRIATLGIDNLHCICMQESRIPESKVRQLSRKFDGYGWELISSPQPPVKKLHGRSSGFSRSRQEGLRVYSCRHSRFLRFHPRLLSSAFSPFSANRVLHHQCLFTVRGSGCSLQERVNGINLLLCCFSRKCSGYDLRRFSKQA